MKKIGMLALMGLLATGAFAQAPSIGWLGLGGSTGGFANFEGTEVSPLDTGKVALFGGLGFSILPPVPLYIGFEFNMLIAQVGEDSATATVYREELIDTGTGYEFYGYLGSATFVAKYFDIDISPRVIATLTLAEGLVTASAFAGINANYLTMNWEYTDPNPALNESGEETLAGPVWQSVFGLRATALFFYMDYTRYFNFTDDGKVDKTSIAGNRVSLGVHFTF